MHSDGKARFVRTEYRDAAELPDRDYPLYLTTGRYREQYNSGAQTRNVESLNSRKPEPLLEVHPSCLERFNLAGSTHVRLETRRGHATFRVQLSNRLRVDTLFVPFHYSGAASVNRLTSCALDPISRMPEFKICAARLKNAHPVPKGSQHDR
jgi:assimilatory nitrate reductase catalytic subunit